MGVYLYTMRFEEIRLRPIFPEVVYDPLSAPRITSANTMKFLCRMSALYGDWNEESRFGRIQRARHVGRWKDRTIPAAVTYGEPQKGCSIMLTNTMELADDWGRAAWFDCNSGTEYGVLGDRDGWTWDLIVTYDASAYKSQKHIESALRECKDSEVRETTQQALYASHKRRSDERTRRLVEYGGFTVNEGWVEVG